MSFSEQFAAPTASFREFLSPEEWCKFARNAVENQALQWLIDCKRQLDAEPDRPSNVRELFFGIRDAIVGNVPDHEHAQPMMSPLEVALLQKLIDAEGTHQFSDTTVHEAVYLINALRAWEVSKLNKVLVYGMDYRGLIQAAEVAPVLSPDDHQSRVFTPISLEPMERDGDIFIGHTSIPVEHLFDGSIRGTVRGLEPAGLRLQIMEQLWPIPNLDHIENVLTKKTDEADLEQQKKAFIQEIIDEQ